MNAASKCSFVQFDLCLAYVSICLLGRAKAASFIGFLTSMSILVWRTYQETRAKQALSRRETFVLLAPDLPWFVGEQKLRT